MTDTFLFVTMSNDRQRKRQLKCHINQLLSELRLVEPNNHIQPFNISISSHVTTLSSHDEHFCPHLSSRQQKAAVLHSTTNDEYRKKSKKFLFAASARATSTPKSSPIHNKILLKPHQTSTPRRTKPHSTALAIPPNNNNILLKRLLYNKDCAQRNQNKRRHSVVPVSKRSILPRLHPIEENAQWI